MVKTDENERNDKPTKHFIIIQHNFTDVFKKAEFAFFFFIIAFL